MKGKFIGFITFLLFVFLLSSYSTSASARLLAQSRTQGEMEAKANGRITQAGSLTVAEEDFSALMGSEENCNERDEECLKRRMIADAHLDYIYTQHHKP